MLGENQHVVLLPDLQKTTCYIYSEQQNWITEKIPFEKNVVISSWYGLNTWLYSYIARMQWKQISRQMCRGFFKIHHRLKVISSVYSVIVFFKADHSCQLQSSVSRVQKKFCWETYLLLYIKRYHIFMYFLFFCNACWLKCKRLTYRILKN